MTSLGEDTMNAALSSSSVQYARSNQTRFLDELQDFLRIPSISTQPAHKGDVERAATWLHDHLRSIGFPRVEVMETPKHPIVYADWLDAGEDKPTVLIYGHYDVQPPDPMDQWRTPPFEPTVIGDDLFARGASDDKGQTFVHIKALEAFKMTEGHPPVNVKCLFEGEEEIGSPDLDPFIEEHQDLLTADLGLISDTPILGKDMPAIIYALRGLAYIEVTVTGPSHDLHSGHYGGAVNNPINVLCRMISRLQDEDGHITIPGFYDSVRRLPTEERAALSMIPFEPHMWLKEVGLDEGWGEPEYTIVERTTARPTLDVNGIWGGYIEPGTKTVLPSQASAKISMRLVPDQTPPEITRLVSDYLREIAPSTVRVDIKDFQGGNGAIVQRDSAAMHAAFHAYTEAFGRQPLFVREGGSIPVVATFQNVLGIETILMGFGLPDDQLHAPNEKFHIPNFYKGIETSIRFMARLGA
jgi:acetylornithine deacetylase/succinyl-diaminopimelate desuccinylase-like protein